MKEVSRIVILKDNKILFIHRIKNGIEYFVLPGGSIEREESPEEAAVREAKEETNFDIELDSLLWKIEERDIWGDLKLGYYFLVKSFKGELKLGGPEIERQSKSNVYLFEWLTEDKMKVCLIYPKSLKQRLVDRFFK